MTTRTRSPRCSLDTSRQRRISPAGPTTSVGATTCSRCRRAASLGNGTGRLGGGWGEVRGLNGVIIAAPSRHADGGEYRWVRTGLVPVLPDEIAEQLPDGNPAQDAASDAQIAAFTADHTEATRSEIMAGWVKALQHHFETGSRHNGALSVTTGALKEARCGYLAAKTVIDTLEPMFVTAATRPPTGGERQRTEREARDEYGGIVAWSVAQANTADLDAVRARTSEKMPDNITDETAVDVTHSAHLGMAIKMGKQFKRKMLYVNKIGWHYWDQKRYAPDSNGAARRAVHSVIKRDRQIVLSLQLPLEEQEKRLKQIARYETASAITGILTEAAALEVFSVEVADLDADPWLFNCANGTLDLRTMKLRDHDPADRITKVANAAYRHETGAGTEWKQFLEKVLPDKDVRDYTQRLTSLSLLGEVNGDKQIAPIMTGGGANGKTTFIEAMSFALGDYAATAEPTLLMAKRGDAHPTGVADLLGRRFVSVVRNRARAPVRHRAAQVADRRRHPQGPLHAAGLLLVQADPPAADGHQPSAAHRRRHRSRVAAHPRHPVHRANPQGRPRQAPQGQAARRSRRGAHLDHPRLEGLPRTRQPRRAARGAAGHRRLQGRLRRRRTIHQRRMPYRRCAISRHHPGALRPVGALGGTGRLPAAEPHRVRAGA